MYGNNRLTSISLPKLATVGTDFHVQNHHELTSLSALAIRSIGTDPAKDYLWLVHAGDDNGRSGVFAIGPTCTKLKAACKPSQCYIKHGHTCKRSFSRCALPEPPPRARNGPLWSLLHNPQAEGASNGRSAMWCLLVMPVWFLLQLLKLMAKAGPVHEQQTMARQCNRSVKGCES